MTPCVVLPAYNEAENIRDVIRAIKALKLDVLVVDDGSEDETYLVAAKEQAYLIRHPRRTGKGASLKDGIDYAIRNGYNTIITMDADGQHDTSDIPAFLNKVNETGSSVVVGNRMDNPIDMPVIRILTNKFMSAIISGICKQKIPDTQCGYRLFKKEALDKLQIEAQKFEVDSEVLIKIAQRGQIIESVPIKSIYADEVSKIRPIRDSFRFILFLFKIWFKGRQAKDV